MNGREKRIFVCSARTERVRLNIMFFKGFDLGVGTNFKHHFLIYVRNPTLEISK